MPYKMWINGTYTAGTSSKVIEVRNPATEEVIDTAPAANATDVEQAVSAAQAAFPAWKNCPRDRVLQISTIALFLLSYSACCRQKWEIFSSSVEKWHSIEPGLPPLFHASSHAFLHVLRLDYERTRAPHSRVDSVPCVITWSGVLQYTRQVGAVNCPGP